MKSYPKQAVKLSKAQWKKLVNDCLKRDGYTCQSPYHAIGCSAGNVRRLSPHHIIPKSRLRLDIKENILMMSDLCHSELHKGNLPISVNELIEMYGLSGYLVAESLERIKEGGR